jgi:hypothetical protein
MVSSEEVTIPPLKAAAVHDVTVKAAGPGIVAWRYAKKEM